MIREEKFVLSHRPYAVDLDSLRVDGTHTRYDGATLYSMRITAAWFRRRGGITYASLGFLRASQTPEPANGREFLSRHGDGRYGGTAEARWDGSTLWAPEATEDFRADCKRVLVPMLAGYPACPPGFDAWWRFA